MGRYSVYWGQGGPTLPPPPLFRRPTQPIRVGGGRYSVYGGERGAYSAPLFRGHTLHTGVVGGGRYSVYGGEGCLLCPLFRGLSGWGGRPYSVYEGEGRTLRGPTLPTGVRYSAYGGEGGLLCTTISRAYSSYWGRGDATLSTGVGVGATLPPISGAYSTYWGVGGATLSTGVRGAYSAYWGGGGGALLWLRG